MYKSRPGNGMSRFKCNRKCLYSFECMHP
uniref:Uncharacterized protein n=1 Tax=Anguilla anguilla TaxID=7936 RepID=A0A0E9VLB8_ANGAN